METNKIFKLPAPYQKLNTLPDDPENSVAYGLFIESAQCFVMAYQIPTEKAMDYTDKNGLIDGIHNTVTDTQALIEVGSGVTANNRKYIYSIIKNRKEPSGVQYFCLLHIDYGNEALSIKAFFDEAGTTGIRDTTIFSALVNQGHLDATNPQNGWTRDPYDNSFKRHYLMNLSELEQFDENFPGHPLTLLRVFIKETISTH